MPENLEKFKITTSDALFTYIILMVKYHQENKALDWYQTVNIEAIFLQVFTLIQEKKNKLYLPLSMAS